MSKVMQVRGRTECVAVVLALILTCGTTTLSAQTTIGLTQVIVRDEEGNGVASVIFRRLRSGHEEELRHTDNSGVLTLDPPEECDRYAKIRAVPAMSRYYDSDPRDVSNRIEFTLSRRPDTEEDNAIVRGLRRRELVDNPAVKLLIFSERAARARSRDPAFAAAAEERAYIAAGEVLDVSVPMYFDRTQDKLVASEALETAIGVYQAQNDLDLTRKLDVRTVEALTGRPYFEGLYGVHPGTIRPARTGEPKLPLNFTERVSELGDPALAVLAVNATNARTTGLTGLSALLFNELTARLGRISTDASLLLAVAAETELYRLAGQVLSIDQPIRYDPLQDGFVVSQPLSKQLRILQMDNGLEPTGRCDYATLRILAGGVNVAPYLTAVRVPEP